MSGSHRNDTFISLINRSRLLLNKFVLDQRQRHQLICRDGPILFIDVLFGLNVANQVLIGTSQVCREQMSDELVNALPPTQQFISLSLGVEIKFKDVSLELYHFIQQ
jgi:hypothetical protein